LDIDEEEEDDDDDENVGERIISGIP